MKKRFLLILILALAGSECRYFKRDNPVNVLVITVDTLRADHLNAYDYPRNTSPELAMRAASGILYEKAFVQWPKTVPSMVSIFSSTYPHTNGILFGSRGRYIPDDLLLMPEIFRKHGYSTWGVVSNAVLAAATNFSQGFQTYQETWMDVKRGKKHSQADHVTDLAVGALDSLKDQRFFLWLHYVDPHYQYSPPPPFDRMFVGDRFYKPRRILKKNPEDNNYYDGLAARIWQMDEKQERDYYIAQYDAEIRFLDWHLARLFRTLDRLKLWENSIVVLTADHGESLGENHYYFEHGWFPYTSCSHVPLIVWDPRQAPGRVSESVALIDLAPSLLKGMKLPRADAFEGVPFEERKKKPVYIDSGEGRLTRANYIRSVWSWPYHLVYVPSPDYQRMMQNSLFELYNVENDWYETRNLMAREPEIANKLKDELLKWVKSSSTIPQPVQKTPEYDPEAIEQMEALGYVQD